MAVTIGIQLGSHEITALLGKGGMGEVYRARDAKLKHDVAIKLLPAEFSRDDDRGSRFQREAEVLASLNHPNIAQIYGLEESSACPPVLRRSYRLWQNLPFPSNRSEDSRENGTGNVCSHWVDIALNSCIYREMCAGLQFQSL